MTAIAKNLSMLDCLAEDLVKDSLAPGERVNQCLGGSESLGEFLCPTTAREFIAPFGCGSKLGTRNGLP